MLRQAALLVFAAAVAAPAPATTQPSAAAPPVREAGMIKVQCMSGLGLLNRMKCSFWSSSHGWVVRIPPGERVCAVRPAQASLHRDAEASFAVKRDDNGAFVDAHVSACPTGPVVLGPPSSVKVRWIVTTIPLGQSSPACDYPDSGRLPGSAPGC